MINATVNDLIPVVRAISTHAFKDQPIPLSKVKLIGCLVGTKSVDYLVTVGINAVQVRHKLGITSSWTADIIRTESEYVNARIRFLGTGAIDEYEE